MKILVLGSGAGGGCPQWNCNCPQCRGLRDGTRAGRVRTQSSIALSQDGEQWVLLNASPDIGQQLRENKALHPRGSLRGTPLKAVILMDAQIDHVTGLLSLREGPPIELYCTPCVFEDLTTGLPILPALQHYCGIHWHLLPVAGDTREAEFRLDSQPGLHFRALAVPGKAPPYSPHRSDPAVGDNVALFVQDLRTGRSLFYAPGLADVGEPQMRWMARADCLIVDGTFWSEDEMERTGLGHKRAAEMGHLPQTDHEGRSGMVSLLETMPAARKLLIHINNSNPILDDDGEPRRELARRGIEAACDGMEIEL